VLSIEGEVPFYLNTLCAILKYEPGGNLRQGGENESS